MYEPELSTLVDSERRHPLIALEALIDFESWARMREFFGLSFDEACAVWMQAIDRLLPPTPLRRSRTSGADPAQSLRFRAPRDQIAAPPESSLPVAPSTSARIDGRRLRSERTKQYIIEAYLALLRENPRPRRRARSPSAPAIRCARCSSAFPTCCRSASPRPTSPSPRRNTQAAIRNRDGRPGHAHPHPGRDARQTCEEWLPLWRALVLNQQVSEELRLRIRRVREAIMARIQLMYRPELDDRGSRSSAGAP